MNLSQPCLVDDKVGSGHGRDGCQGNGEGRGRGERQTHDPEIKTQSLHLVASSSGPYLPIAMAFC